MPLVKTAITVPQDVLDDIDRAARANGESRSKYITRVLRTAARARRNADVTRKLNELFATEEVTRAQAADTGFLDDVGSDWSEEGW